MNDDRWTGGWTDAGLSQSRRIETVFRVRKSFLDAAKVSEQLQLAPSRTREPSGKDFPLHLPMSPVGEWLISSKDQVTGGLEDHLKWLAAILKPKAAEILCLQDAGYEIDIRCEILTELPSFTDRLKPDAMQSIADLGIPIELSIATRTNEHR